jgi:hypothetical protein
MWFVGVFASAAALVYVPTFSVLEKLSHRPLTRVRAVLLGSALALVPRLLIAWSFQESGSVVAWLAYWSGRLPKFALSLLPFVIPGAVFGLLWSRKGRAASWCHESYGEFNNGMLAARANERDLHDGPEGERQGAQDRQPGPHPGRQRIGGGHGE